MGEKTGPRRYSKKGKELHNNNSFWENCEFEQKKRAKLEKARKK